MDAQQRDALWANAVEHYSAARLCDQQGWYGVSAACSYYAVYLAMWVALGDPRGTRQPPRWTHGGIYQNFALGRWRHPPAHLDRATSTAIRHLYSARVKAQYHAPPLTAADSRDGLATARQILRLVAMARGLSQGGFIP